MLSLLSNALVAADANEETVWLIHGAEIPTTQRPQWRAVTGVHYHCMSSYLEGVMSDGT